MNTIILRELLLQDLDYYFELHHPSRKHHQFDGPYYEKESEDELLAYIDKLKCKLENSEKVFEQRKVIAYKDTNNYIGEVSWYWKSKETNWLEIGIVICDENSWGIGIGYQALRAWIDELFCSYPEIVRIGLSTWSGNIGMIKLAEKLSFKLEARYRKARIVDGKYYDSISYGILREEWYSHDL